MRMAGIAMLAALIAGGAPAQTVSKPALTKPVATAPQGPAPGTATPAAPGSGQASSGPTLNADTARLLVDQQKAAGKEAREDRAIGQADSQASLATKAAKIDAENGKIDAQRAEAADKADAAMTAARTQLGLGMVSGAEQANTGGTGAVGTQAPATTVPATTLPIKPCKDCPRSAKPQ